MTKYYCNVIFDASSTVVVEADTPEEAAEIAEDETSGNQHLCHQCSNTLETGDSIGVYVHNEECTEQLLDTTYRPPQQRTWVGLTDEEMKLIDPDGYEDGLPQQIQQALKEKNT